MGATNPNTIFGGKWIEWGSGRVIVGISGESEFNVLEKTGGEKTHTLNINEIPSHSHRTGISPDRAFYYADHVGSGVNTAVVQFAQVYAQSEAVGGSLAHNNLQPYIVARFWKRIE